MLQYWNRMSSCRDIETHLRTLIAHFVEDGKADSVSYNAAIAACEKEPVKCGDAIVTISDTKKKQTQVKIGHDKVWTSSNFIKPVLADGTVIVLSLPHYAHLVLCFQNVNVFRSSPTAQPGCQERWQLALQLFADMLRLKLQPSEAGLHLWCPPCWVGMFHL